jgi:periplasmic protein CpxP/Spy
MTIKSTTRATVVLASLLLPAMGLPMGAFAQTQTPTDAAPPTPAKPKAPVAKPISRADRVEKHIADLHAKLRITPAQQPEWDQFAQVMRENATSMNETMEQRRTGFASMNAADNMQSYAQIAEKHAQDMQKLATTFKALYGAMSDDQKKNADAVFREHGAHPRHGKVDR